MPAMKKFLRIAPLLALYSADAFAESAEEKAAVCLPVAKAGWEATVEVFDEVLAGKPKWEAAKRDPSEYLLKSADSMSVDQCSKALALYGPEGIKALVLRSSREDLAAGKRPRAFD